ncbi:hypothetical protein I6N90_21700 [Paenibacillus sp. GSMTC-2017]|uniref:hypothetical protein n=1 Tax=Paenibacillus sp. GSMTC-2017 TaxID=2794350 RepID=UPI0018D912E4|nr:hypothetical protein [Paenibacillus sp. GSMTC-2017]MBH5320412.1 hypothetical protein [Paenibacillus sp. GSMTC-2017]
MKKQLILVCVMLIGICFYPKSTSALSCASPGTIEELYTQYDGIVEAQVIDVIHKAQENKVKLKVLRSFKAIEESNLTIYENSTWGATNGPSEKGKTYLFFLNNIEKWWQNPLCSPSKEVSQASEELKFLTSKEIPIKVKDASDNSIYKKTSNISTSTWVFISTIVILLGITLFIWLRKRTNRGN